ncbi:DUF4239 domain-containing protein [Streptomyces sp. NPDC127084]|uniref:bestrophin-like domain n=1 Tax=Streptomyces sp. NPDC127084 TaxID=3347133 RepID=UPI0036556C6C
MLNFIYTSPLWFSTLSFILAAMAVAAVGALLTRKYLRKYFDREPHWGDVCAIFSNVVIVFFGLLLALITVAAYETYSHGSAITQSEANEISHIYGLAKAFPDPDGSALRSDLRAYVDCVVKDEWPTQQHGKSPSTLCRTEINDFLHHLYEIPPGGDSRSAIYSELLSSYGSFIDARTERLGQVGQSIPWMLWGVMFAGAFAMVATTFLLPVKYASTHIVIACLAGASVALLIHVTAAMDNPFRGNFRVDPSPYINLADTFSLIDKGKPSLPEGQRHPGDGP